MITWENVTFTYGEGAPVLRNVTATAHGGQLTVIAGPTGAGKSTLLGMANGLVPRFTGGTLAGRVTVGGTDTRHAHPRDLASVVGYVGQDPVAGFVTDTVESELAYAMEQLAVPPQAMRQRVEETLDLLGIADLRARRLDTLSGGQAQRVAIGSVLTLHPQALVLDEPTSALDPPAAEEVLAILARLVEDLAMGVLIAEHRLERVVQFADSMLYVTGDGSVRQGSPAQILADTPIAPPVVRLSRLAGLTPPALSVRQGRAGMASLRQELEQLPVPDAAAGADPAQQAGHVPALVASGLRVDYGTVRAVNGVDLTLETGTITALMGRNGSGKSSLLWALQGSGPRTSGRVRVEPEGADPKTLSAAKARTLVALVPQTPTDLLYLDTVSGECAASDATAGVPAGSTWALAGTLAPGIDPQSNPRDLSEGQRLALVLAIQLVAGPRVVLLDEPTRGLDYPGKRQLAAHLQRLARAGHAIALATHDVEFVADCCDRTVQLAQGEVIAAGPTAAVVSGSPAFAPQVAKILGPRWLTVGAVAQALEDWS